LLYGDACKEIFGGSPETTNNQMEMMAVISAGAAQNPVQGGFI